MKNSKYHIATVTDPKLAAKLCELLGARFPELSFDFARYMRSEGKKQFTGICSILCSQAPEPGSMVSEYCIGFVEGLSVGSRLKETL